MSDYTIREKIGGGGMGQVFRAHQKTLGRDVALKMMHRDLVADDESSQRFEREVALLSTLSHPNIVRIFDGGRLAGLPFFTMELIQGENLLELVARDGPVPPARARILLMQLLEALVFLHERGILHRDLKPNNVLLARGVEQDRIVLVDFGLARGLGATRLTRPGEVMGTIAYLAPELLDREEYGPAQDIWAFGATAYHLVTGSTLFEDPDASRMVTRIMHFDATELETPLETSPSWVRRTVIRSLQLEPADRPRAQDLLEMLRAEPEPPRAPGALAPAADRAGERPPDSASPAPPARPAPPGPDRHRLPPGRPTGLLVAAVLSSVLMILSFRTRSADPVRPIVISVTPAATTPPPASAILDPGVTEVRNSLFVRAWSRSAVVAFRAPGAGTMMLRVSRPAADSRTMDYRVPSDQGLYRQIVEGLQPDTVFRLEIGPPDVAPWVQGHLVRTQVEGRSIKRDAVGSLVSNVGDVTAADLMLAVDLGGSSPGDEIHLREIAKDGKQVEAGNFKKWLKIARELRDRELAGILARHPLAPGKGQNATLFFQMAADCGVTAVAGLAKDRLNTAQDSILLTALHQLVALEGTVLCEERVGAIEEHHPAHAPELVDVVLGCGRDEARSRFQRWISGAQPDLQRAGIIGLARLGGTEELTSLRALLEPGTHSGPGAPQDQTTTQARRGPPGDHIGDCCGPFLLAMMDSREPATRAALAARLAVAPAPWPVHAAATMCGLEPPVAEPPRHYMEAPGVDLEAPPGWRRDLALWERVRRGQMPDPARIEAWALDRMEDPMGVALWVLARRSAPVLDAVQARRAHAELASAEGPSPVRRALLMIALSRSGDSTARLAAMERDIGQSGSLRELASRLGPPPAGELPPERHILLPFLPWQPTGVVLGPGESCLLRSWSLFEPPGSGPGPRVSYHCGTRDLHVDHRWTSHLALEGGELHLSTWDLHTPAPAQPPRGLVVLDVMRDPGASVR